MWYHLDLSYLSYYLVSVDDGSVRKGLVSVDDDENGLRVQVYRSVRIDPKVSPFSESHLLFFEGTL